MNDFLFKKTYRGKILFFNVGAHVGFLVDDSVV